MHNLTEEHVELIAQILIEEFGCDLHGEQLAEHVATLLEDVAGFEMISDDVLTQTIDQIRSAYHVATSC